MNDLISRCELFNRLATIPAPPEANEFKAEIYRIIQEMDDVGNEGKWISCEDKLPDKSQDLLVTVVDDEYTDEEGNHHEKQIRTYVGYFGILRESWYWSWRDSYGECCMKNRCVDRDEEYGDTRITAWMPLPKPY